MAASTNWLEVENEDELPRLNTLPSCLTLSDVQCDNYVRLLAADMSFEDEPSANLKVFRGLRLKNEQKLPGIPAAIQSLYIDESENKTPVVAVAIAESVLFFRHMKPYFKYTLPAHGVDELEHEVLRKLPVMKVESHGTLLEQLKSIDHAKLSRKSQRLLQLNPAEREAFIEKHKNSPLGRDFNIVAMCCLQRISSDCSPPSHLVIATDNGDIYILEPQGFNLLFEGKTCSYETTPSLLAVRGTYETEFCIVIAARNGAVYLLRKNSKVGQEIFKQSHPLTGLILLPVDQTIVITTMDNNLLCYSKKGKQLYKLAFDMLPICMIPLQMTHLGFTLICVAFEGGAVKFYMQRYLVDAFQVKNSVTAMLYGRMGMEDHVLTLVTVEGEVIVKILRRAARFEPNLTASAACMETTANDSKKNVDISILDKSKKSSIFVEQATREKQNAKATYGSFQVELWRLRHIAARATIDAINSSESTISGDITHAPVKLSAEVCGAGPAFRLYLTVQNMSTYKMASNLMVLLHADRRHYTIQQTLARLPSILPGIPLRIDFEVVAVLDPNDKLPPHTLTPDNSNLRVILMKVGQTKPLIAAVVAMPQSEANF